MPRSGKLYKISPRSGENFWNYASQIRFFYCKNASQRPELTKKYVYEMMIFYRKSMICECKITKFSRLRRKYHRGPYRDTRYTSKTPEPISDLDCTLVHSRLACYKPPPSDRAPKCGRWLPPSTFSREGGDQERLTTRGPTLVRAPPPVTGPRVR